MNCDIQSSSTSDRSFNQAVNVKFHRGLSKRFPYNPTWSKSLLGPKWHGAKVADMFAKVEN
ncbi:zinc finger protein CONSTANS-LIKE 12 [Pyrus ussuriensis x Pyrus communis]|uniref:Zinc finger protein CONSTANS-LIKE 12 n=1 Tax=Pyrus ussuriensis x Pyrus communis TaxID=2448454 RepID=A0A5N5GAZ3_9ROSA|nr:zinc finger protein CONSTANS-LIKE 12 [Pyrus ussuriensis x Pyrus communis]